MVKIFFDRFESMLKGFHGALDLKKSVAIVCKNEVGSSETEKLADSQLSLINRSFSQVES